MYSPYQVLQVPETSSINEITQAYKKLARRYHPDRNPNGKVKMQAINDAYDILKDPLTRQQYHKEKQEKEAQLQSFFNLNEYHWDGGPPLYYPVLVTLQQIYARAKTQVTFKDGTFMTIDIPMNAYKNDVRYNVPRKGTVREESSGSFIHGDGVVHLMVDPKSFGDVEFFSICVSRFRIRL